MKSWRALPWFLILAFVLSWYPWALHVLGYSNNPNPNPLGVFLAALIAAAVDGRARAVVALLRSIVRVGAPALTWLATFAIPLGALALSLLIAALLQVTVRIGAPPWADLLETFIFTLLFVGFGEEPGWRGFLQPMLQRRLSPIRATAFVAAVWAFWHLPLMGTEFAWRLVPAFLVNVVAATFVLAWLYNASRGSVLLPMLMHATTNTAGAGFVFRGVPESDLVTFWWIFSTVWIAIAAGIAIATRGRLGLRDQADRHQPAHSDELTARPRSTCSSEHPHAEVSGRENRVLSNAPP